MKKKSFLIAAVAVIASAGSYFGYGTNQNEGLSDIQLANIEALAKEESGELVVNCYCKTNWFTPNVCSANASGAYCGGDPCPNHDGNCR